MKTITEYQPLIFGKMQKRSQLRAIRRTNILNIIGKSLPAIYILAGIGLMADTGYMPWNWQFWLVLAPLFLACEGAFWAVVRHCEIAAIKAASASSSGEDKRGHSLNSRWIFTVLRPLFARSFGYRRILGCPLVRAH